MLPTLNFKEPPAPGDMVIIETVQESKLRKVASVFPHGFTTYTITDDGTEIESVAVLPFWRIKVIVQPEQQTP